MPNYADPNLDFTLEEQLQKAKWLRAQEQKTQKTDPYRGTARYVAPGNMGAFLGDTLTNIAGDRNARRAESTMRGLSAEQIARIEALNQQLNTPQNINWSDPQAIQGENSRRAQIVGQQQRMPMVAGSANKVQEQLQRFPETMMIQKQRADEIAARQADQQASYQNMQQERLRAQAERQAQADQTRLLIQAMANQSRERTAGAGGAGTKLSAAEKNKAMETDNLLGKVDEAIAELKAEPDAVGLKTTMPNIALQRAYPKGIRARAAISELSADKKHELLGSAMTKTEMKLVEPFLPGTGDSYEKSMDNLTRLRKGLIRIKQARQQGVELGVDDFNDLQNISPAARWFD